MGTNKQVDVDLLVIGGGINGVGVARDAAGRGLSVLLCEKDDLAEHTSSASTKLIHGGLRYLEYYDFKLVRHALKEREVLLRSAPHIIWPMRFILPHHVDLRPRWLIRLGLFLYDYIGGRKLLPASHSVNFKEHESGNALQSDYTSGFEYSDCWVQDSRLVVLNAMDARARGAEVLTHNECLDLTRKNDHWVAKIRDKRSNSVYTKTASAVINASGPWVEKTLNLDETNDATHGVRLVKGSHIVVPKLFDHPYAYIFQNADNRVLFAVPYENDYTLLGTTDVEIESDPGKVAIDASEIDYICQAISEYFAKPVSPADVRWSYSGVRPLYDDSASSASKVTRDYKLHLDTDDGAPILSIYGGKITTFRKLAEEVVDLIQVPLGKELASWTTGAHLPGGDIPDADFEQFLSSVADRYAFMPRALLLDYARNYGTKITQILQDRSSVEALGRHFGGLLYQCEIDYLVENEWANSVDDILWRRSKKGLQLSAEEQQLLADYLKDNFAYASSAMLKRVS